MKSLISVLYILSIVTLRSIERNTPVVPQLPFHPHPHTFFVTDTSDSTQVTSVRGAIIEANRLGGQNIIVLRKGNYQLSIPGAHEDAGLTGDLDVTRGDVTIVGVADNVTIDATGLGDRVFHVMPGAHLSLSHLTITGGTSAAGSRDGEDGGGILNAGSLRLFHCTVTGNACAGGIMGGFNGSGGGVCNVGKLLLRNCTVSENSGGIARTAGGGGNGGGIVNAGTLIMKDSVVLGNAAGSAFFRISAFGHGGGIYNTGNSAIDHCIINGNIAGGDFGPIFPGVEGGVGGGICNFHELTMKFCTIADNSSGDGGSGYAGGDGAGIWNAGTTILNTCTISGNKNGSGGKGNTRGVGRAGGPGGSGGGVYNTGFLFVAACTITRNTNGAGGAAGNSLVFGAPGAPGGSGGHGGGILNVAESSSVNVRNTIIALNSAGAGGLGGMGGPAGYLPGPNPGGGGGPFVPSGQPGDSGADGSSPDVFGLFDSHGYNFVGIVDGSNGFSDSLSTDILGNVSSPIDPLLGPLQMNGGPTPTHALLPGSPAIDRGKSFGVNRDQRGRHRPHNYPSVPNAKGGDGSDIGAFEVEARGQ